MGVSMGVPNERTGGQRSNTAPLKTPTCARRAPVVTRRRSAGGVRRRSAVLRAAMSGSGGEINSLVMVGVLGAICLLAVLANLLVLVVIAMNRHFRAVTDVFICNLAVSDLLLAGIAIPLKLNEAVSGSDGFVDGEHRRPSYGCHLTR